MDAVSYVACTYVKRYGNDNMKKQKYENMLLRESLDVIDVRT